jgi:hypothetical protein
MSKKKNFSDPRQKSLFDFTQKIESLQRVKEEITQDPPKPNKQIESFGEACVTIAAAAKRAIRQTNLSREQMVDSINEYFGDTKKPLSNHMFNHYLSKPTEYPMPAALIFAIQRITSSLEIVKEIAGAEGARVISGIEVRQMALGKLEETIVEMQKLKRELKLKG